MAARLTADHTIVVGMVGDYADYVTHCATTDHARRDAAYHRGRRNRFTSVKIVTYDGLLELLDANQAIRDAERKARRNF